MSFFVIETRGTACAENATRPLANITHRFRIEDRKEGLPLTSTSRGGRARLRPCSTFAGGRVAGEERVREGHAEEREHHRQREAADNRDRQRLLNFAAGADADRQRGQSGDRGR